MDKQNSGINWLWFLIRYTVTIVLLYLVVHWLANLHIIHAGNYRVSGMSKDQMVRLNELTEIKFTDTGNLKAVNLRKLAIKDFLSSSFPELDETQKIYYFNLIELFDGPSVKTILTTASYKQHSFFWLYGDWIYVEIIFWCFFGVFANLLYSVTDFLRLKKFEPLEIYVQIAKLCYSPFCVIVIYLCYNLATSQGQEAVKFSGYTIAVSFLLGFFSGRMIDLLNRLKEVLIPIGKDSTERPVETTAVVQQVPEEILKEAIDKYSAEWKKTYNLKGVGLGKKKINGLLTEANCLIFKPIEKKDETDLNDKEKIPETIVYKATDGNNYNLYTDVQETGGDIRSSYQSNGLVINCEGSNIPTPGCSVSRLSGDSTGTIGLKVYKNNKAYILGCYHVLCAPELRKEIFEYKNGAAASPTEVISPGKLDGGDNRKIIGTVAEGFFNSSLDCAIAELADSLYVNENICKINKAPRRVVTITTDHVSEKYAVRMTGRTSGMQKGYVTDSYCDVEINYHINGKDTLKTLRGLICCSRISDGGDSGAAVVDAEGNVLGIVLATGDNETYILPIIRILLELNIQLKP